MRYPGGLSPKEQLVLRMLSEHGELNGAELVAQSSGELARGTVYVTLDRLEGKGFVVSRVIPPKRASNIPPKRVYKPTARAVRVLEAIRVASAAFNRVIRKP